MQPDQEEDTLDFGAWRRFLILHGNFEFLVKNVAGSNDLNLEKGSSKKPVPFVIDCSKLFAFDPELGESFLLDFQSWRFSLEQIILPKFAKEIIGSIEFRFRIRVTEVPIYDPIVHQKISDLRNEFVGKFVTFSGRAIRAAPRKVLEEKKEMKCTKCGFRFLVEAAPEMYYQLDLPLRCPSGNYGMQTRKQFNPKQKKTKVLRCDSWQFEEFPLTIERTDCQELTLQESTSTLGSGSVPRAVSIVLLDELIESAQPGDDIVVYGLLWRRWKTLRKGQKCEVSIFIEVVSLINFSDPKFQKGSLDNFSSSFKPHLPPVEDRFVNFWKEIDKSQDGRISGRTRILDRICPHLAGIPVAKLSLILALIGGSTSISKVFDEFFYSLIS
eukprot:GHVP01029662.1.p1 GENE.GHVP01029662.1~~GHVP01029662.1.p1  ORF type:complete len:384 (+),score=68.10 GHVP01029662.1:64-1215(+)